MRSNHCHYKSTQYKTITDLVFWWDEESAAEWFSFVFFKLLYDFGHCWCFLWPMVALRS